MYSSTLQSISHISSIGKMSGGLAGHERTATCEPWRNMVVTAVVWDLALYCFRVDENVFGIVTGSRIL